MTRPLNVPRAFAMFSPKEAAKLILARGIAPAEAQRLFYDAQSVCSELHRRRPAEYVLPLSRSQMHSNV
jgi:hypothetical protein